jgi:hypothetical protein
MSMRSYSEIRDQISRELTDLSTPAAREAVVEHLTELTFELGRIREQQRTVLAALRARDVLLRDRDGTTTVASAGPVELDARDALDGADGLHDIEWDEQNAYRWTGPGRDILFRVWLDRALPIVCEIGVLNYGDERNRRAISLTVDGFPVAIAEAGGDLLRSAAFPTADRSLFSEIGIHVPFLSGPAVSGADGDQRVRGIAITRLRFLSPT